MAGLKHTKKNRKMINILPAYGSIATGIIYAAIGVIAILSFLKFRHGGADESSLLIILNDSLAGKLLIWLLLLGTVCYILWRFYETITDPYDYGATMKGFARRTGIALSSVADILIVYAAIRVLLGTSHIQSDGQPKEEQQLVHNILQQNYGKWFVIGLGLVYLITSIIQFIYGITRGYRERVNIEHRSALIRNTVHVLAWAGYFARGIILGIIGFFFVKAGVVENARFVVNTDKAFDFIGDHIGHVYFILIAIGTICYGLFMMTQGIAYDTDKD
jgi:hypothetical protein